VSSGSPLGLFFLRLLSANPLSGANQEIRDYSGKKPRQYLVSQEAAVSQDTFHSKYTRLLEKRDAAT